MQHANRRNVLLYSAFGCVVLVSIAVLGIGNPPAYIRSSAIFIGLASELASTFGNNQRPSLEGLKAICESFNDSRSGRIVLVGEKEASAYKQIGSVVVLRDVGGSLRVVLLNRAHAVAYLVQGPEPSRLSIAEAESLVAAGEVQYKAFVCWTWRFWSWL